jgi:L-seryl-tRNA(Ser) seleniumtransferase
MRTYEDQVRYLIDEFSSLPHTSARRNFPSEAGQPMPRAEIIFDEEKLSITRNDILTQLRGGEPSIELPGAGASSITVNPQTLKPGEERIIASRIKQIVHGEARD